MCSQYSEKYLLPLWNAGWRVLGKIRNLSNLTQWPHSLVTSVPLQTILMLPGDSFKRSCFSQIIKVSRSRDALKRGWIGMGKTGIIKMAVFEIGFWIKSDCSLVCTEIKYEVCVKIREGKARLWVASLRTVCFLCPLHHLLTEHLSMASSWHCLRSFPSF